MKKDLGKSGSIIAAVAAAVVLLLGGVLMYRHFMSPTGPSEESAKAQAEVQMKRMPGYQDPNSAPQPEGQGTTGFSPGRDPNTVH